MFPLVLLADGVTAAAFYVYGFTGLVWAGLAIAAVALVIAGLEEGDFGDGGLFFVLAV
jgi:hypothetical protein